MKRIKPADAGYKTTNALLAYCLHLSGLPWLDPRHPVRVLYSKEILDTFINPKTGEPVYKGWEFEKAVIDAHKTGKRGHIQYKFEHTSRLKWLLKAYKLQEQELETASGYVHEVIAELIAKFATLEPDIAMMRLSCIMLKKRLDFMSLWEHQVPCMLIPNEGEIEYIDEQVEIKGQLQNVRTMKHPGFRIMSTNASQSTREHLGV
jgi:hypothetical protein